MDVPRQGAPGTRGRRLALVAAVGLAVLLCGGPGAEAAGLPVPFKVSLGLESTEDPKELTGTLQILLFFTLLSLLPALLLTMTSFTRIIIVLSFVRRALSLQTMPPNQVMIGLALFLTLFTMAPVLKELSTEALDPYQEGEITQAEAFGRAKGSMRGFMLRHTREKDLALFVHMSRMPRPKGPGDVPTHVLIPAFVTSELKTAFQMGFIIFLPFLVIDMVVSSVLTSMGMFMLPPVIISVPFKILLFVLVDGWHLILRSLMASFA
ncbi:MAG: flagellar type III secretion system pore protein FliP [Candidatus Brocadiia bacterium]